MKMMMSGCCNSLGMLVMGGVHLVGFALLVGLLFFIARAFWHSLKRDFPVLR